MKINWYIRFKNPVFVFQIIMSVLLPVLAYNNLAVEDLTTWQSVGDLLLGALLNPYVLALVAISIYNAITDPTVKSWASDSKFSQQKTEPTDPKMPVDIKGKQEVNDETEIVADNTDADKHKPRVEEL